ncbi:serine/threonine-protein kinase [Spirillospora sp. NPDC127200]
MPASPLRSSDPETLGPYRLVRRLGRGGMGTVFLGEDAGGRRVAVKVINAELSEDAAFQERFRREVTAARQVRRFCTAAVLDARLDGDPLYVVTEYVNGPTLEEAVQRDGPMRGGDLDALAVGIATALTAIHGAGIVHRDLKPANVLLSPTGPRVIDFGIARALDAGDGPTRTGQFVGTPAYIAPEIVDGAPVSPAADVFAWGCVVAFAGTGRAPFAGRTVPEIIRRVAEAEPDLDGLDPALHGPVRRALEKDPARRPRAEDLLRLLTGQSAGPPPAEPQPAAATVADPPVRSRSRRRWLLPAGALAALAVAAAALVPLLPDGDRAGPRPAATKPRPAAEPLRTTFDFSGPPPQAKRTLYTDGFDDPRSGLDTGSADGREYYDNGSYVLTNRYGDDVFENVPGDPGSNLRAQLIDTRVRFAETSGDMVSRSLAADDTVGLYCYYASATTGVRFHLTRGGLAEIIMVKRNPYSGGVELDRRVQRQIPGFDARGPHRLQAACAWTRTALEPSRLQLGFWVDGRPVARSDEKISFVPSGPSGIVATSRWSDDRPVEARFEELSLGEL